MTVAIRIGQGIDFHQLESGRDLFLGGVKIPSEKGCVAHSDGDVLIHAICDAILGAAGLRDIGYHFPDTDNEFKGIDSRILLERSYHMAREKGYSLGNVDATLCLEKPKIAPHIGMMKETLAKVLATDPENIAIKATTTEKMGFTGRGEGVVALAVVLLTR